MVRDNNKKRKTASDRAFSFSTKRRSGYVARGRQSGSFSGRGKSSLSAALRKGIVIKNEKSGTLSDRHCVYVGHNSMPIHDVLRGLGYSIARMIAIRWKQNVSDMNEKVGGSFVPASSGQTLIRYSLTYHDSYNSAIKVANVSLTDPTWVGLGTSLINTMMSTFADGNTYYCVREIRIGSFSTDTTHAYHTMTLFGNDISITLTGKSVLKIQNITVSSQGDDLGNESKDDIAANPLRGLRYFGRGMQHIFRFQNNHADPSPAMAYNKKDGFLELRPDQATDLTAEMRSNVTKPQPYKFITGTTGNAYVHINPGEIKTSLVSTRQTLNLNQWIKKLWEVFRKASLISNYNNNDPMDNYCPIGNNSIVALEHIVDIGTEPAVNVGYELNTTLSAICTHKHKAYCNPIFEQGIFDVAPQVE